MKRTKNSIDQPVRDLIDEEPLTLTEAAKIFPGRPHKILCADTSTSDIEA